MIKKTAFLFAFVLLLSCSDDFPLLDYDPNNPNYIPPSSSSSELGSSSSEESSSSSSACKIFKDYEIVPQEGITCENGKATGIDETTGFDMVQIGEQVWTSKNLGEGLPYGDYYTWTEAKDACPKGWHLPSKEEFETLEATVNEASGVTMTAHNLKATQFDGEDIYGFTALLGGERYSEPEGETEYGGWWSATQSVENEGDAYRLKITYEDANSLLPITGDIKDLQLSVRCVRNSEDN
ncbi:hypothetical protein AGMMS49938_07710 [Fibrobacterales bacterium]|nr:hypothetical protein AGMMS49938_07710 [Fibrobacterales bacterium]